MENTALGYLREPRPASEITMADEATAEIAQASKF
jgi:hypothetical protein